jgi:hypothetical protein
MEIQMIKNFDEIKKQLADLAVVINSYKSEAVQVKIIEALLSGAAPATLIAPHEEVSVGNPQKSKSKAKKKSIPDEGGSDGAKSSKVGGKKTPKKSVVQLVGQGFFKERQADHGSLTCTSTSTGNS